jgi:hypothetical protein
MILYAVRPLRMINFSTHVNVKTIHIYSQIVIVTEFIEPCRSVRLMINGKTVMVGN